MANEIFFFATRDDMLKRLKQFETVKRLKYIKCGGYNSPDIDEFQSGDEIPDLGINNSGNHQSESYLIQDISIPVLVREIKQSTGEVRYFVDQMLNKESIVIWPSGIYGNCHLICGHIATISSEKTSLELYKPFSKMFVKDFKKVGKYYIGPEALSLTGKMRFITMNVNQPIEYDLKVE